MKKQIFPYLIIAQIVYQSEELSVKKQSVTELDIDPTCKKIKCPPVLQPLCVRMKYVSSALQTKIAYVVMFNRCEMKYLNCIKGAEGKELPMSYCEHKKNITSIPGNQTLMTKRRKREIDPVFELSKKNANARRVELPEREEKLLFSVHANKDKERKHLIEAKKEILSSTVPGPKKCQSSSTSNERDETYDSPDGIIATDEQDAENPRENDLETKDDDDDAMNSSQKDEIDREDYVIESGQDYKEEVNMSEYNAECPKSCPTRGIMLCAKCKDDIYRTFLTTCHMKMFHCAHPEEKLTLVSRYPCALSAPYLEDLKDPKGIIDEPNDEDVVLRYLRCKEYLKKKLRPYAQLNCVFNGKPLSIEELNAAEEHIEID